MRRSRRFPRSPAAAVRRAAASSYVDNGRDPDAFTERSLRACAAERASLNGKLLALEDFRTQLQQQMQRTFGDARGGAAGGAGAAAADDAAARGAAKPQR